MPIFEAASEGDTNTLKELLKRGENPNQKDRVCLFILTSLFLYLFCYFVILLFCYLKEGWTPLHLACRGGHISTVALLLDKRAEINCRTKVNYKVFYLFLLFYILFFSILQHHFIWLVNMDMFKQSIFY